MNLPINPKLPGALFRFVSSHQLIMGSRVKTAAEPKSTCESGVLSTAAALYVGPCVNFPVLLSLQVGPDQNSDLWSPEVGF